MTRMLYGLLIAFVLCGAARAQTAPEIMGDGIHDDGPGFVALFCKLPYVAKPGLVSVSGNKIDIHGTFYVAQGLIIYGDEWDIDGHGSVFRAKSDAAASVTINTSAAPCHLTDGPPVS